MSEWQFRFQRLKYVVAQGLREGWYRAVRAPAGKLIWTLWGREILRTNRVVGRRVGIENLPEETWIWIDPQRISRYIASRDVDRKRFLRGGDWDQRAPSITEHERYQLMQDVWQHRGDLRASESFRKFMGMIERGKPKRIPNKNYFLNTEERVLEFLEAQLVLFDSMATHGIKPELAPDEMNVAIGRDGEIIKANAGRKRAFGARILGLPAIPVRVAYIHEEWFNHFRQPGVGRHEALSKALASIR